MEKLLNVARREHSKVIVQLQQLTRELTRDKERAIEAGELKRARLEQELAAANKKLQSVQVERNLLLVCLYAVVFTSGPSNPSLPPLPFDLNLKTFISKWSPL